MNNYPIEPFRIKSIEHIKITTKEERKNAIKTAHYNLFNLPSEMVMIDLLTDSGTGAMSDEQWAAIMTGDESYSNSKSFENLSKAVNEIFTFYNYFLPVHQGRAAESILSTILIKKGSLIPSNTHFDTTAANILIREGTPINLVAETNIDESFKGNIDIEKLDKFLKKNHENVPYCMVTITNNAGGGQPVSLSNIEQIYNTCRKYKKQLFIDACRFAENSWFIKQREPIYKEWSIKDIAKKIFSFSDGATFSAKKDAIVNIGGLLLMNDKDIFEKAKNELIIREGFPTYGGLAGRDINAMAIGLKEGCDEKYLEYRTGQIQFIHDKLVEANIPIISPPGGHAIYINAGEILSHIPSNHYPAQAFSIECYIEGGIRSVEIGSVMLSFISPDTKKMVYPKLELVRFAFPRRTYTLSHILYVIDIIIAVCKRSKMIKGIEITEAPELLRHFSASFNWIN